MSRAKRVAVLCLALAAACDGGGALTRPPPSPTAGSAGSTVAPIPNLDPEGVLSADPATLAADLTITFERLRNEVDRWTDLEAPPSETAQLLGVHQQRLVALLADTPALRDKTLPLLTGPFAREIRTTVEAGTAIRSGITPAKHVPSFSTGPPDPAGMLRGWYEEAEARFGVSWELLAAVNFVETRFGRVHSASYAAAKGPMQFLSSTWKAYGMGGNVHDPHDAILGAANYLAASGAPADDRAALWHYNPSKTYVKAVSLYARQITRDPRAFLMYYTWQVFVITTKGDVQLTGPGSRPA
ncbi:MAG TPA: lytic transglycosylase domain-containing protein [Actinomycetota bacterium]|jgi:membrane-bound lytic murein transglycosylase B